MLSRIYVKGYDRTLTGYDLVISMREHFASCGEVIHVYIPGYFEGSTRNLNRFAFIFLRGEGAEEKALKLSGSHMGEHKIVVESYPFHAKHLDPELAHMREADNRRQHKMSVTGYDTSLPLDYVKTELIQHFCICGHVLKVMLFEESKDVLCSTAFVTLRGEDAVEKALQLGGCDEEGLKNVEVSGVAAPEKNKKIESDVEGSKSVVFGDADTWQSSEPDSFICGMPFWFNELGKGKKKKEYSVDKALEEIGFDLKNLDLKGMKRVGSNVVSVPVKGSTPILLPAWLVERGDDEKEDDYMGPCSEIESAARSLRKWFFERVDNTTE